MRIVSPSRNTLKKILCFCYASRRWRARKAGVLGREEWKWSNNIIEHPFTKDDGVLIVLQELPIPFSVLAEERERNKRGKEENLASLFENMPIISLEDSLRDNGGIGIGTDLLTDSYGGIGHTFEGGWHKDPTLFDSAYAYTKKYLACVGSIEGDYSYAQKPQDIYVIYKEVFAGSEDFKFVRDDLANFEFMEAGEVFAIEGDVEYKLERDSYLIFIKQKIIPGYSAICIAYKEESN